MLEEDREIGYPKTILILFGPTLLCLLGSYSLSGYRFAPLFAHSVEFAGFASCSLSNSVLHFHRLLKICRNQSTWRRDMPNFSPYVNGYIYTWLLSKVLLTHTDGSKQLCYHVDLFIMRNLEFSILLKGPSTFGQ